jgi:SSS family solute:Na+ symporter
VVAVVIAMASPQGRCSAVEQAFQYIQEFSGFVTPGITVIFLLGLFWPPATEAGALVAAVASVVPLADPQGVPRALGRHRSAQRRLFLS